MNTPHTSDATAAEHPRWHWPDSLRPLLDRASDLTAATDRQRWVVRGGPGTGKTALVADVMRHAMMGGARLDEMIVLTHSAVSGAKLLDEATSALPAEHVVGLDNPVRTIHSLAFGILRLAASRADAAPPRLLAGAEHDAIIRHTLRGEILDGAEDWPETLRPALATVGFARELRDLLLRSLERGIGPEQLARMGRQTGRPEWVAAAKFFHRHEQQMELRGGLRAAQSDTPVALNAAELVGAALDALTADPQLLEEFTGRTRLVAVDDAHNLDPLAAELVTRIGGAATLLLVVEDGDQSVYRFRGASGELARAVADQGGHTVSLARSHRMTPALAAVSAQISSRLPGAPAHRAPAPGSHAAAATPPVHPDHTTDNVTATAATVAVRVLPTAAAEAAAVADFLRRRHVLDGIPWSQMAIITRSVPSVIDALLAAADAAAIPVVDAGAEIPPAHDTVAAALLAVLSSLGEQPSIDTILGLLTGPIGRADPVALRRLRRGIRRARLDEAHQGSAETLRHMVLVDPLADPVIPDGLTDIEYEPVSRLRAVRRAALRAVERGDSVEEVLWAAWSATGLAQRLAAQALTDDAWSRSAHRSLDAVVVLFDHAADYVDRIPGGSLAGFIDLIGAHDLPAPRRVDTRVRPNAVSLLSAHSAVGGQWQAVAVCGVQDGTWPAPPRRSGILAIDEFVDLTERSGAAPTPGGAERRAASAAQRAAEERRLFHLACSRACQHLLVSAVESVDTGDVAASRFVDEIRDLATDHNSHSPDGHVEPEHYASPAVFTLAHLVAELRCELHAERNDNPPPVGASADRVATGAEDISERSASEDKRWAAGLLAGLRDAGIAEADPHTWYAVSPLDVDTPPFGASTAVSLSPSAFGALEQCPARWFLERVSRSTTRTGPMVRGMVVHAAAQAIAGGVGDDQIAAVVRSRWPSLTTSRGWFVEREIEDLLDMVACVRSWQLGSRDELVCVGVEVPFEFTVHEQPTGAAEPETAASDDAAEDLPVRVRGRIDRVELTRADTLVAVDVKTATTAVSAADALVHPQLALYQLAIAEGAVEGSGVDGYPAGGGQLVYVGGRGGLRATVREQNPLDSEAAEMLRQRVYEAGRAQRGPGYVAQVGPWCEYCPVRTSCPAQPDGEQVVQ